MELSVFIAFLTISIGVFAFIANQVRWFWEDLMEDHTKWERHYKIKYHMLDEEKLKNASMDELSALSDHVNILDYTSITEETYRHLPEVIKKYFLSESMTVAEYRRRFRQDE